MAYRILCSSPLCIGKVGEDGRCQKCGTVCTSSSSKSGSDISSLDETSDQFIEFYGLVERSMALSFMLLGDENLTVEQQKKCLAFELGIIEYYDRLLMRSDIADSDKEAQQKADTRFFNFLIYYSNKKYEDSGEDIFQFFHHLAVNCSMLRERELGFNAVKNWSNPDGTQNKTHTHGLYLLEALGIGG